MLLPSFLDFGTSSNERHDKFVSSLLDVGRNEKRNAAQLMKLPARSFTEDHGFRLISARWGNWTLYNESTISFLQNFRNDGKITQHQNYLIPRLFST